MFDYSDIFRSRGKAARESGDSFSSNSIPVSEWKASPIFFVLGGTGFGRSDLRFGFFQWLASILAGACIQRDRGLSEASLGSGRSEWLDGTRFCCDEQLTGGLIARGYTSMTHGIADDYQVGEEPKSGLV
jgi:hypothetical protein